MAGRSNVSYMLVPLRVSRLFHCCSAQHAAAAMSLTAAMKAAGGSLGQLRSFSCVHVVPTEQLLQVRPVDCGEGSG